MTPTAEQEKANIESVIAKSGLRWFGDGGYETSEDIEIQPQMLGRYEVRIIIRATRSACNGGEMVGITARYSIWKNGSMVPYSDQRGIGPVFSIEQVVENARRWLERYHQDYAGEVASVPVVRAQSTSADYYADDYMDTVPAHLINAWNKDEMPIEVEQGGWGMPEAQGGNEGAEDGDLDSMIQMWERE